MSIFMKFLNPTADIKGESTTAGFVDAVELYEVSWGLSHPPVGAVVFADISATKGLDLSTQQLALYAATGGTVGKSTIDKTIQLDNQVQSYVTMTLWKTRVSSVTQQQPPEDQALDMITFTFDRIEVVYRRITPQGQLVPGTRFAWDLVKSKTF